MTNDQARPDLSHAYWRNGVGDSGWTLTRDSEWDDWHVRDSQQRLVRSFDCLTSALQWAMDYHVIELIKESFDAVARFIDGYNARLADASKLRFRPGQRSNLFKV